MPVSGSGGPIKILKYNLNRDFIAREKHHNDISFIGQCPSMEYRAEEENVERCTVLQKSNENRKVDSVAKSYSSISKPMIIVLLQKDLLSTYIVQNHRDPYLYCHDHFMVITCFPEGISSKQYKDMIGTINRHSIIHHHQNHPKTCFPGGISPGSTKT